MTRLRVLALTHSPENLNTRFRAHKLQPFIGEFGIDLDIQPITSGFFSRRRQFRAAADYHAVILMRRLISRRSFRYLRRYARRLVYDFDEAIYLRPDASPSRTRTARFREIIQGSDAITPSNEHLAEVAERHGGKRTQVLPLAVDTASWRPKPASGNPHPLTLGWLGTPSTHAFLRPVVRALGPLLAEKNGVRLKVVSSREPETNGIPVEWKPFSAETESEDVLSFDVGMACYPDDEWTKGKSPAKIVTYMAAGLPVLASDVACVRRMVRDGETGFLVRSESEWADRVRSVARNWTACVEAGRRARRAVEEKHDVRKVASVMADLLRDLR